MIRFSGMRYSKQVEAVCRDSKLYEMIVFADLLSEQIELKDGKVDARDVAEILIGQDLIMTDYGLLDKDLVTTYETFRRDYIKGGLSHYDKVLPHALVETFNRVELEVLKLNTDKKVDKLNRKFVDRTDDIRNKLMEVGK